MADPLQQEATSKEHRCSSRCNQASICLSPGSVSLVYRRLYSYFVDIQQHPQSVRHYKLQMTRKVCSHTRTPTRQYSKAQIIFHWLKQTLTEGVRKSALHHGGARERCCLSHGSTSERFAEKAPVERMFFYTAGGFQMTNSKTGIWSGTAALSCEARFVLLHSSFLHKQALSFTHLFTLSKSHHIAMQRRLSSGYLFLPKLFSFLLRYFHWKYPSRV